MRLNQTPECIPAEKTPLREYNTTEQTHYLYHHFGKLQIVMYTVVHTVLYRHTHTFHEQTMNVCLDQSFSEVFTSFMKLCSYQAVKIRRHTVVEEKDLHL